MQTYYTRGNPLLQVHQRMKYFHCLWLCLFISCQKEEYYEFGLCPGFDHCEDMDPSNCGWQDYDWHFAQYAYSRPSFNPLNPQEFVYVKIEDGYKHSIWKYNLQTGENTWIVNTSWCPNIAWTIQNQIVWTNVSGIYRINPDGTDLFRLDASAASNHSVPSPDGMLVYGYHHPNNEVNIGLIFNLDGEIVDTVNGSWFSDWRGDGLLYGRAVGAIGEHNVVTGQSVVFHNAIDYIPNGSILDTKWRHGHNEVIFSAYQQGLYSYSLVTGEVTQLKMSCKSTFINSISISPDGEAMLLEVEIWKQRGEECTVDVYNEIWLAHISGCGTTQVLY